MRSVSISLLLISERETRVALGPVFGRSGKETNSLASVLAFGVASCFHLGLDTLRLAWVESVRKPTLQGTGDFAISDLVSDAKLAVGSRFANGDAIRFCAVVLDSDSIAKRAIPDGFASYRLADRATVIVISHWLTLSFEYQVRLMGRWFVVLGDDLGTPTRCDSGDKGEC